MKSLRAVLSLPLALALLGCGSASSGTSGGGGAGGTVSSSAGTGGSSGSTSTLVVPPSCVALGLEVELGCEQCPAARPACECTDLFHDAGGVQFLPEHACTFGKCLASVDCDRVCRNIDVVGGFGPGATEDIEALRDCVRVLSECNDDDDCGTGNFCIEGAGINSAGHGYRGRCSEPGHDCNRDADCLQGSHCVAFWTVTDPQTGERIALGSCSTGEDDQPCTVDDDCAHPYQCVNVNAPTGGLYGECSTGVAGEPCVDDSNCIADHHCVNSQCSAGAVDDFCNDGADCQSGFCFKDPSIIGTCTSGVFPAACRGPEDCQSGYCSVQIGSDNGYCSGDEGAPCLYDTDCASALCGLNPGELRGICVAGNAGSPCFDDGDCLASTCVSPDNAEDMTCLGMPGSACDGDGVCTDVGQCFKGKCG